MDDQNAAKLTRALGHPLRISYLKALTKQPVLSPSEYAREAGVPLGNVSYHVGALRKAGVVEIAARVPRRGAMEHCYSLTGPLADEALAVIRLLEAQ
jgi:DNA-binding transcriptional ArsR family regulator